MMKILFDTSVFEIVSLTSDDYALVIQQLANRHMTGGIIYDALIMQAAIKAEVEHVLTLNRNDFVRIAPDWKDKIIQPI